MTDKINIQEEPVELLEDDEIESMVGPEKRGMKTMTKVLLGAGGMAVIMGGALLMSSGNAPAPSVTTAPGQMDATPGGKIQANSPLYQESVRRKNEDNLKKAEALGTSSIPMPEFILKPKQADDNVAPVETKPAEAPKTIVTPVPEPQPTVIKKVIPKPPAAPQAPARPVQAAVPAQAQQQENPFEAAMSSFISKNNQNLAPEAMKIGAVTQPSETQQQAAAATPETAAQTADAPADTHALVLRPGDILYAETITSVNSDSKTPVLAEVTTGKFKGARLVGSFSADKASGKLVVAFKSMTMEDGTVYGINALAVDGKSAQTAVASDVNHRYIKRYGPILAAAFISGYAQAEAQPTQETVDTGSSTSVVTSNSSAKQSLMAGVAAASSAVANDIASYAAKGPLISLRDGYPVAVLIIDPVEVSESVQNTGVQPAATAVPRPGSASQLPDAVLNQPVDSMQTDRPSSGAVMQAPVLGG